MQASRSVIFVALSGVRVKSVELTQRGMTLPGFAERSRVIASLPSPSLLTLAACTPSHWEMEYREVDGESLDQVTTELCSKPPTMVAISSFTARIEDAYRLADLLRTAGLFVVLGGLHVSALPEEAAAHADSIIVGEGESAWPQLLSDWEDGVVRSMYRSAKLPAVNLGTVPIPRFDLLDPQRYNRLTLQASRGCPHHCDFFGASRTISPYRLKPIHRIR